MRYHNIISIGVFFMGASTGFPAGAIGCTAAYITNSLHHKLIFQEFQQMFFTLTNGTEIVLNNEFRHWVHMGLQYYRAGQIFVAPYFMPAFCSDRLQPAIKQVGPECF
jgi:TRAP-type mannitol/chloroaromatic compound transport system permease large subunit